MEENNNTSSNKDQDENPFLSSNVKDILKRRREDKNKKSMKKMNLISITNEIETNEDQNENEEEKMIDNTENIKTMKELEEKAKKNYKSIYSKHNKLDVNYNPNLNKLIDTNKNKKNTCSICCKETFFFIINIISFFLFYLSFEKKDDKDIIYYYFIYPINKISLILILVNASITSLIIILVKIKQISLFHLFYTIIFYMWIYFKYDTSNNSISSQNYFNTANYYFFIFFIIMIHTLGVLFILYSIAQYFYLSGQYSKNETNLFGMLIDYWESERNIKKLEKYININLDKLITSKGYSHEENIINKKKNNIVVCRIISIGFIILLVHILLFLKKNTVFNCDYFNEGIIVHNDNLNKIDDDKFCKIPKPKGYCYMTALTGFFNKYTYLNNCTNNKNFEKKNYIDKLSNQYENSKISENTNIFGYPLTNNKNYYFSDIDDNSNKKFEEKINKEIYDIHKFSNNQAEAILDYSDEKNPQLKIDLQYNAELSNERKGLEFKDSLFKNVFVVYLSGVSQFYFKTVLPKVSSFIQGFTINNPQNKDLSFNSYQFTRYHSFSNDSFSNYFLMFYDSSINPIHNIKTKLNYEQNLNINDHLQYFKENGYITGQSTDTCINYDHLIHNIFWDHENMAISCDINYLNNIKNNNYCLYGNPFYTYHINYALQFWEKYKDNRKYFRLNFNSFNENEGSLLTYLDESLNDLFLKLNFNGLLDDTAIFFVSEFGEGQDKILYNFGIHNEKDLNMKFGSFILLLNKYNKLSTEEKDWVYYNQNKMLTPFDIYASLVHIPLGNKINNVKLFLDEENKGESVFKIIIGDDRNDLFCEDYWGDEKFCACLKE